MNPLGDFFKKAGEALAEKADQAKKEVSKGNDRDPVVRVLKLKGTIMDGGGGGLGGGSSLNIDGLRDKIKHTFNTKGRLDAVALVINSPGGSPVQSDLIAREIRYWADKKDVPVFTFVEDVAASGGYWLACAGDEIYVLPASITGSIGVISSSFGFQDLIKKHGVERRVYTAGDNKSQLDPFKEPKQEDIDVLKDLQLKIHEDFKGWVKKRRAGKLKRTEKELMNGRYWTGQDSLDRGLVDGIGDIKGTLTDKFGERVQIVYPEPPVPNILKMLMGGGLAQMQASQKNIGEAAVDRLVEQAEHQAMWAKYGLKAPKL